MILMSFKIYMYVIKIVFVKNNIKLNYKELNKDIR